MPSSWRTTALFASFICSTYAVGFDCSEVMDDSVHWNLKALAGTHLVQWEEPELPMIANWTFAVDLCHTIPKDKDIDDKEQCPQGTNVCGIKREHEEGKKDNVVRKVVPISGAYLLKKGIPQEVTPTRLKNSGSSADAAREGVRLEMYGGRFPFDEKKESTQQKAIIELICNREMTGWEPAKAPETKSERIRNRDDDNKDDDSSKNALRVLGYKDEVVKNEVWGVLRLEWQTKHACEDAVRIPGNDGSSAGWGFFTWLIVILFMAIAAYVIMGAWMNYTKYGARGVDLLPHSDTIRDIPYIIKDMLRRLQGGNSRGGYSAV